jgi:hypothetical protein
VLVRQPTSSTWLLLLTIASPAAGQVTWTEVTGSAGILPYSMASSFGGGVAAEDFDQDGDVDLFVPQRGGLPNQLYRNLGDGTFQEIAAAAGLADTDRARVGLWLDYDGDHRLDLLTLGDCIYAAGSCAALRTTKLYRQVSEAVFVDVTVAAGLEGALAASASRQPGGVAAGDVNGDGFLDLFLAQWHEFSDAGPDGSRLFLNGGDGTFTDVTAAAGLVLGNDKRWQPLLADLNGDGAIDIYSTVDAGPNRLWLNQGAGTFVEQGAAANVASAWNDMGVALGDPDNDGDFDLYVTNVENAPRRSILLENVAPGPLPLFDEIGDEAGLVDGGWGWGASWLDADLDAWLDLAHTNGVNLAPYDADESRLYRNQGALPLSFADISAASGFDDTYVGVGLVAFDRERDGDLDVFQTTNNVGGPARLLDNAPAPGHHFLVVRPRMSGPNHWAIGAVVHVSAGGRTMMRPILAGTSHLSQEPAEAHFGLGTVTTVDSIRIEWPDGTESLVSGAAADQTITLSAEGIDSDSDGLFDADEIALGTGAIDPDSDDDGVLDGLEVGAPAFPTDTDGDETIDALDADDDGDGIPTAAEDANGNGVLSDDDSDGDGIPDFRETDADGDGVADGVDNCRYDPNPLQEDGDGNGVGDACAITDTHSIARQWNEELLGAIRRDFARPTVHARNLFHTSAAMWDAWAAYDESARQLLHQERATAGDVVAARAETLSFAAYRVLRARFATSPGAAVSLASFAARMDGLGYDRSFTSTAGASPAALGNRIAATVLAFGLGDGSNEANGFANQHYAPVNPPLIPGLPGNPDIVDANRWQPLAIDFFIDQSGNPVPGGFPPFLSPEWGQVVPFALSPDDVTVYSRDGFDYLVYHDPGGPPLLGTAAAEDYLDTFEMVVLWSSHLDPSDGVMWDVSPASQGNAPLVDPSQWRSYYDFEGGGDIGTGYPVNPVTGQPYPPQIVPRGDYVRALAEFWADGPSSETPPGHWFTIANYVSDHPLFEKRLYGQGAILDDLEWDVKLYITLGGAMHDVAVTVWGMKGWYDYIRPVSAIRAMAERGQRSDPGAASYHPEGFELRPGFIELVTAASSAPGERHEHLAAYQGEVAVKAWRGPEYVADPDVDVAGVGWIRAKEWWPYQRPTFVTPPFAGFPSGHSAYSRAASELLTQLTGSPYFPGGLGEFHAEQNDFLVFEEGPSVDVTLQYASYYDASDQTSLSRIWGGIHPPADDLVSRHIGAAIAVDALAYAQTLFTLPACSDGVDNDGDGAADHPNDLGCTGALDASERQPGRPCDDGSDNDGDGLADVGADPGCASVFALTESPECQDGRDNDAAPGIDFDGGASLDLDDDGFVDEEFNPSTPAVGAADPQCWAPWRARERLGACGLGFELMLLAPLLSTLRRRRRA